MTRFLLLATLLVLCPSWIIAQEKQAADPRAELRYDDKPFSYWEKFPRTELKAERRVDAVRAMAAFGVRGYAKEATAGLGLGLLALQKSFEKPAQGEKAKSTVPLLLKTFDAANPFDKIAIVSALGKIGPSAGDAMPVLRKQLQSDNAELRQAAAEAIEAITRKQEP